MKLLVISELAGIPAGLAELAAVDPYAAEQTELAYARALRNAGRGADAKAAFANVVGRYLRSVPSVHARRIAASELAAMGR